VAAQLAASQDGLSSVSECLFNDVINNSAYIAENDWMMAIIE
jgi:hypothetical protein